MSLLTPWRPMQPATWDPFKELAEFEQGLERFFGRKGLGNGNGGETTTLADWQPLTDITEDEKEYLVKVELPEMKKEDVQVNIENGILRIKGERKAEKEEKTKKYHRIERSYGTFERSFTLPEAADGTKVTAEYKDGILRVHLPKTEKAKATITQVKVA